MPDYRKEVNKEAIEFITDHEDMILEGLKEDHDWDRNDMSGLDEDWHSSITDRAYTLSDAAWVLDNCDNEETDRGLWEGQEPREAVQTQAAYSFSNDVWFRCEELYKEIKETYSEVADNVDYSEDGLDLDEDVVAELELTANEKVVFSDEQGGYIIVNDDDDSYVRIVNLEGDKQVSLLGKVDGEIHAKGDNIDPLLLAVGTAILKEGCWDSDIEDAVKNCAAASAYAKFEEEYAAKPEPVEPGSDEEKRLIERWLRMNDEVGMRGGYPMGSSYIDSRCGTGYGQPDQLDYVNFDHELAARAPHLAGKYTPEVEAYYQETYGEKFEFRR